MYYNTAAATDSLIDFANANGIKLTLADINSKADTGEWLRTTLVGEKKKNVSVKIWLDNGVPNADIHVYGRAQGHLKWIYKPGNTTTASPITYAEITRHNEERRKEAEEEIAKRQELAAKGAAAIWAAAKRQSAAMHPYLMRKSLPSYYAHALTGAEICSAWRAVTNDTRPMYGDNELDLVIPLTDAEEKIWNVQRIRANSYPGLTTNKLLLRGARKKGLFCEIRSPGDTLAPIIIAEGWATAASIDRCVSAPVGVYMGIDKDNLLPAAREIQRAIGIRHPIVFAGDNDCQTEGNPGKTAATKAAEAIGGIAIIPDSINGQATDWSDVMLARRPDMQKLSEKAINEALWEKRLRK